MSPKYKQERPSDELRNLGKLFARHIQEDADNFKLIQETLSSIDKKLEPITDTYDSVSRLGKWGMTFLVSVSLIAGIIYAIIEILVVYKK